MKYITLLPCSTSGVRRENDSNYYPITVLKSSILQFQPASDKVTKVWTINRVGPFHVYINNLALRDELEKSE